MCEHSTFARQTPHFPKPPPLLLKNEIDSPGVHSSTLIGSHRSSTAALSTQQSSRSREDGFSGWTSSNTFRTPAAQTQGSIPGSSWVFGTPVSKGLDPTPTNTPSAVSTWATPTISAMHSVKLSSAFAPSKLGLQHQPASFQSQPNLGHHFGQLPMAQESAFYGRPLDSRVTSEGFLTTPQDGHENKPVSQPLRPEDEDVLMHEAPRSKQPVLLHTSL